ncbi:aminomethyltransferase family protein [Chloroflexota bacterium]
MRLILHPDHNLKPLDISINIDYIHIEGHRYEFSFHPTQPIGLAARDSLRFEPCMPLYGHELSPTITPLQARLSFAVSFDKYFIGRDALLKQKLEKPEMVLVGFELTGRGVAREHYPVLYDGEQVGFVSSGMYSPTTSRYLGMAFVPRNISKIGTEIEIQIRKKAVPAKIIKRPFYIPAYRR